MKVDLVERWSKEPEFVKALTLEERIVDFEEATNKLPMAQPEVFEFAAQKHRESGCSYGDEPYDKHLLDVSRVLYTLVFIL